MCKNQTFIPSFVFMKESSSVFPSTHSSSLSESSLQKEAISQLLAAFYIKNTIKAKICLVSTYTTVFSSPPGPSFVSVAGTVPMTVDGPSSDLKQNYQIF